MPKVDQKEVLQLDENSKQVTVSTIPDTPKAGMIVLISRS